MTPPPTSSADEPENFTAEERAAMKERAKEVRASRRGGAKPDTRAELLAKIAEMDPDDRAMAERVHAIVEDAAPDFTPKLWYGMPAYYSPAGKAVLFFQAASKFKARYATLGFNDSAALDDGEMWPVAYALRTVGPAEEQLIRELVARATQGS